MAHQDTTTHEQTVKVEHDHAHGKCTCGLVGTPHPTRSAEGYALAERDATEHSVTHATDWYVAVADTTDQAEPRVTAGPFASYEEASDAIGDDDRFIPCRRVSLPRASIDAHEAALRVRDEEIARAVRRPAGTDEPVALPSEPTTRMYELAVAAREAYDALRSVQATEPDEGAETVWSRWWRDEYVPASDRWETAERAFRAAMGEPPVDGPTLRAMAARLAFAWEQRQVTR